MYEGQIVAAMRRMACQRNHANAFIVGRKATVAFLACPAGPIVLRDLSITYPYFLM